MANEQTYTAQEQSYYDLMARYMTTERTNNDLQDFLFKVLVLLSFDKEADDKKKIAQVMELIA